MLLKALALVETVAQAILTPQAPACIPAQRCPAVRCRRADEEVIMGYETRTRRVVYECDEEPRLTAEIDEALDKFEAAKGLVEEYCDMSIEGHNVAIMERGDGYRYFAFYLTAVKVEASITDRSIYVAVSERMNPRLDYTVECTLVRGEESGGGEEA